MSNPNFTDVLDTPMDSIERPKPLPTGTYIGQIVGLPSSKEVTTKNGEQVTLNINVKLVTPQQLDNPDALSDYGDITTARPLQRTFWFSKPASPEELWAFRQFCVNTLKVDTTGKSMKQVCAELQGKQLIVTVGHNVYQDKASGDMVTGSQIAGTAAL